MKPLQPTAGYFRNGLPYNRMGRGPRPLIIFQGTVFANKPQSPLMVSIYNSFYRPLEDDYTLYSVFRKPNLPAGYSLKDMADDYAAMIRQEFGGPVDVIGLSTGGSIAQHFAADHPDLLGKLVIHSSAYLLPDSSREIQNRVAGLARRRRWLAAYVAQLGPGFQHTGARKYPDRLIVWIGALFAFLLEAPRDPSDLAVVTAAEDRHNFKDRLGQIRAATLVVAGDQDPFYSAALFRETAAGIPNARLILYPGMGHPASGEQFGRDLLTFLVSSQ